MSKAFFAIAGNSTVVNGITVLELDIEPIDAKSVQQITDHIRLTMKNLSKGVINEMVDNMIEENERAMFAKMLVGISEPDFNDRNYGAKLSDQVYAEYDKRFPREVES
jgi:hypothetical protein